MATESREAAYKLSYPRAVVLRMGLFLALAILIAMALAPQVQRAFFANPGLNGLILGVLLVGIVYAFRQVMALSPEVTWVNGFRRADPGLGGTAEQPPHLLAPMATMLRERQGRTQLSAFSMRSLLDSIGSRLDEQREISRYMIGLLIFLGLLGTFWGLLQTVSSVSATMRGLDMSAGVDPATMLTNLRSGLEGPLNGMGTAFSSSLFGLSGSLVLGFLDLQAGQAQNRFYNELEEWLSTITTLSDETTTGLKLNDSARRFDRLETRLSEDAAATQESVAALLREISALTEAIKQERAHDRAHDRAASRVPDESALRPLIERVLEERDRRRRP